MTIAMRKNPSTITSRVGPLAAWQIGRICPFLRSRQCQISGIGMLKLTHTEIIIWPSLRRRAPRQATTGANQQLIFLPMLEISTQPAGHSSDRHTCNYKEDDYRFHPHTQFCCLMAFLTILPVAPLETGSGHPPISQQIPRHLGGNRC